KSADVTLGSAAVAVRITRDGALDVVPRVTGSVLGLVPIQLGGVARAVPTGLQLRLQLVVPLAVGVHAAGLGAVAVGRTVVVVVVVLGLVVLRALVLVAVELVGRVVGFVGTVAAINGIPRGGLGLFPSQARLCLGAFPATADIGLQRVIPLPTGVLRAHLIAVLVSRRVVAVIAVVLVAVRT